MDIRKGFGLTVHMPSEVQLQKSSNLGPNLIRMTVEWSVVNWQKDIYEWAPIDRAVNQAKQLNLKILGQLFKAPRHLDPQRPFNGPANNPREQYLNTMRPEWVERWQSFVRAVCERYPNPIMPELSCDTEMNLNEYWDLTPEDFVTLVLAPMKDVANQYEKRLVAPGITIQRYDGTERYNKAVDCMQRVLKVGRQFIDRVSIHAYHDRDFSRIGNAISDFRKDAGLYGIQLYVTECGIGQEPHWNGNVFEFLLDWSKYQVDKEVLQLERLQKAMMYFLGTPSIARWYYWRAFDTSYQDIDRNTAGLLKPRPVRDKAGKIIHDTDGNAIYTWEAKRAGKWIQEQFK